MVQMEVLEDQLTREALPQFARLVDSVGVKKFSSSIGVSTRQVNRILAGAQTNPIDRTIRSIQAAQPEVGDAVLDYMCQEMGGHFVRHEAIDGAMINAVRECAEAIAAISDGKVSDLDVKEIREAISALSGLILSIKQKHNGDG